MGDSHARGAFVTLVGILAGFDYDINEGKEKSECVIGQGESNWAWMFDHNCKISIEKQHPGYKNEKLDITVKLLTCWHPQSFTAPF